MRHLLLAITILLVGCGSYSAVEPREKFWTNELSVFFEEERTLTQLHSWLREHDVYYVFDPSEVVDGAWRVELERVLLNEVVCESWFFYLDVAVEEAGRIESHSLEQMGVCL